MQKNWLRSIEWFNKAVPFISAKALNCSFITRTSSDSLISLFMKKNVFIMYIKDRLDPLGNGIIRRLCSMIKEKYQEKLNYWFDEGLDNSLIDPLFNHLKYRPAFKGLIDCVRSKELYFDKNYDVDISEYYIVQEMDNYRNTVCQYLQFFRLYYL